MINCEVMCYKVVHWKMWWAGNQEILPPALTNLGNIVNKQVCFITFLISTLCQAVPAGLSRTIKHSPCSQGPHSPVTGLSKQVIQYNEWS